MTKNPTAFYQFCSELRRKGEFALCLVLCTLGLGLCASAHGPTIITFDAQGAGTGAGQGTTASYINSLGVIIGYYLDANNVYRSLLRNPNGGITTFEVGARAQAPTRAPSLRASTSKGR
jgi:hypothetical protein